HGPPDGVGHPKDPRIALMPSQVRSDGCRAGSAGEWDLDTTNSVSRSGGGMSLPDRGVGEIVALAGVVRWAASEHSQSPVVSGAGAKPAARRLGRQLCRAEG